MLPSSTLEPYDEAMADKRKADADTWGERVRAQLRELFPGARFVVLAGAPYARHVDAETPLAGLQMGERLAWFKAARGR